MPFPPETFSALVPTDRTVGNVTLHPLTLRGVMEIARAGIDIHGAIPADRVFIVAHVLSVGSSVPLDRFLKRAKVGLNALCKAVEETINEAFSTYLKPQPEKNRVPGPPTGLGWPLEIAEFLCAEYGWNIAKALDTPASTAFALVAAYRQRNDVRHGEPDYVEKIAIKEWKASQGTKHKAQGTKHENLPN